MIGDITQIKRMLADKALSVAEHLLPKGRRQGQEWRAGSINGEQGQSLGVHLSGSKAGMWADFNGSGASGDLIDLWAAVRGMPLNQALEEARGWLGIVRPEPYREPKKNYTRPPKPQCRVPQARVLDYLTEDRNLSMEAVRAYRIGEAGDEIVFPFLLPDGVLAMVKTRKAEDGAKPKPTAANCEPVLFGWQAIPADAREVVITEGEIDAQSMFDYGFPALSVPFGGGAGAKQQWIENEFERMDRFERIYLATDMDKAGDEAADAIANRLGRHRCVRVKLPRKDANQCRVEGVPAAEIARAIAEAEFLTPAGLKRPSDYTADVTQMFWPSQDEHQGYRTPYSKLGSKLLFRSAEVTLWCGASGSGKSQLLSDCIVDWIKQGSRVCLCSLEMKPQQTLKRMVKQVVGVDRPTEAAIQRALEWLDNGLLIYERLGKAGVGGLLEIFAFAQAKYGCDQLVIDSLMRLGIESDDYVGQEKAVFEMVDWTVAHRVHLHLVAHSRKSGGAAKGGVPEAEDVKGAMEIGANAFNILTIWRNRPLEKKIADAPTDEEKAKLAERPGVVLNVAKQRNGDFEGVVGLWFDQANYRYRSSHDGATWKRQYLEAAA
ncbi:MAG: toprim domain-containing protein [Hyphomonadaceae bacterium]|jgi:twinkle protein|nr:toprim domain-containing protein [Hyphomonadaceae bacterium]